MGTLALSLSKWERNHLHFRPLARAIYPELSLERHRVTELELYEWEGGHYSARTEQFCQNKVKTLCFGSNGMFFFLFDHH